MVHLSKDCVVIEPKGSVPKFAALKRGMKIPLSSIVSVSRGTVPRSRIYRSMRVAGTALPPHFAGRFYSFGHGLTFLALSDRGKCVTLKLHEYLYREVIVQVEHKEKVAETIERALAEDR